MIISLVGQALLVGRGARAPLFWVHLVTLDVHRSQPERIHRKPVSIPVLASRTDGHIARCVNAAPRS